MKVLVADDSVTSRHVLDATLRKWGYEVVCACDGEAAWQILQAADAPRLAILDWMMPGKTGLEICGLLRRDSKAPYTYILLLTARSQMKDLVEGMDAGADDYLCKPFNTQELNVRLRAGRRIVELQAALVAAREELREQATTDALTRTWNRASIIETLQKELARAAREKSPLGVVMVDLDHFKKINDTYGHMAGDAVLREAARRMVTHIRSYDAMGRYGGEEFLLVLPGCDEMMTAGQAERLRGILGEEPMKLLEEPVTVTASFGCTAVLPGTHAAPDAVIRLADEALYRAKRNGRNRVELIDSCVVACGE